MVLSQHVEPRWWFNLQTITQSVTSLLLASLPNSVPNARRSAEQNRPFGLTASLKWNGMERKNRDLFCSTRSQTRTHTLTHAHRATQRQGQNPPECSLLLCLWKIYTEVISSAILSTSLTQEGFKEVVSVSAFCDDCVPVWRCCLRVYIKHDHPGAFFVLLLRIISALHRATQIIASPAHLTDIAMAATPALKA